MLMQRFIHSASLLLIVVLATGPAPAAGQETAPDMVREPSSGTPFPVLLTPPGGTTRHWLAGMGIRQRTIFRLKIYAFGLYVDPTGARAALSGFAGIPAAELQRDARLYRRLLDLDFGMTLRLVMTRTVGGGDIASAFDDALRPRLARAATGAGGPDPAAALDQLRGYLDMDEVSRGTEILFSCNPAGRLATAVGGNERPPIDSRPLCRALFDIYLGEDPISRDGKRSLIAGFPGLLAPGAARVSDPRTGSPAGQSARHGWQPVAKPRVAPRSGRNNAAPAEQDL